MDSSAVSYLEGIRRFLEIAARELEALIEAKTDQIRVEEQGRNLVVRVKDELLFDTGFSEVKPGAYSALAHVAQILNKYSETIVRVNGHTDSTGSQAGNQALSERWAQAVAGILESNGVGASRTQAKGFGASQSIASNSTPEGRQMNRRVDIVVVPTNAEATQAG